MIKWIVVTLVAGFIMLLILAGIGNLLQSNKEANKAYIEQVQKEEQAEAEQAANNSKMKVDIIPIVPLSETESFNTLSQHLICVDASQCTRTLLKFSNASCVVAVNKIGAASLRKVKEKVMVEGCDSDTDNGELVCLNNICQFSGLSE